MNRSAQAIVFPFPNQVETREFTVPDCGNNEIVVETRYSMISTGTELRVLKGLAESKDKFPLIPGYSAVGRIVEVGSGVSGFQVGDLITRGGCLPVGDVNLLWGGQISLSRHDASTVLKIPNETDPLDFVISEIAAIPWRGVKYSKVKPGEKVLVIGQGLIGAFSAKFFTLMGAEVAVADVVTERLERAKRNGAVQCLNAGSPNFETEAAQFAPGGYDIIVEATGRASSVASALHLIRPCGLADPAATPRLILQGSYFEPVPWQYKCKYQGLRLEVMYPIDRTKEDRQDVIDWISNGRLKASDFVDAVIPSNEAPKAYPRLQEEPDKYFSVVFSWNRTSEM